jgi:hypothetical protein
MPTLADYRDEVLKDEGGQLGITEGEVDLDPDVMDRDAARSIISARLFDTEYLAAAYGGSYIWIPRWSDSRRAEERGYRVRYIAVFEPPSENTYRIQAFGFGETKALPRSATSATIQSELRAIHEDLVGIEVFPHPDGHLIHLPFRLGLGSTAGRFTAQGGAGIILVNRDFSQALRQGDRWILSPRIPFETEDNIQGLHDCINLALSDIIVPDLLPVAATQPKHTRSNVIPLSSVAPWLTHKAITGYYAPTDWLSITTFVPPKSGSYTFTAQTALSWGPSLTPLPYNATGAQIEAAISGIVGSGRVAVEPQTTATSFQIGWRTLHHEARITPSAGNVTAYSTERLGDPFPIALTPNYRSDFEGSTLTDPGYPEDQSWFVEVRRRANQRICPQTWPRRSDGSMNTSAAPILGTQWVESTLGLRCDLDQALPAVEEVAPAALRYAFMALASASPAGEDARWQELARRAGVRSAAKQIYGPVDPPYRRQGSIAGLPKSLPFFLSDD